MTRQLTLLATTRDWRIDEATREVGRRGIAQARAALAAATPRRPNGSSDQHRPAA